MASGCILSECFICGELVFEDEAVWYNDVWKHSYCKTTRDLRQENEALKRELEEYRRWLKGD